jgi:hypothetical protein
MEQLQLVNHEKPEQGDTNSPNFQRRETNFVLAGEIGI